MKWNKIIKILSICFVIITFSACDPEDEIDPIYRLRFFIKNTSNTNLILKYTTRYSDYGDYHILEHDTINKDSIILFVMCDEPESSELKNNWFEGIYKGIVVDCALSVYDNDSNLLIQWYRFYDNSDTSKQFFRESNWSYRNYQKPDEKYIYHEWTFEITDADLH